MRRIHYIKYVKFSYGFDDCEEKNPTKTNQPTKKKKKKPKQNNTQKKK